MDANVYNGSYATTDGETWKEAKICPSFQLLNVTCPDPVCGRKGSSPRSVGRKAISRSLMNHFDYQQDHKFMPETSGKGGLFLSSKLGIE